MRRVVLALAAAVIGVSTGACGGGEVVVSARLTGESAGVADADTVNLSSMEIRLFPFDRDAIFDSLAQAYPEPEPEVPDSIFDLQQRMIERQREWQEAELEWAEGRDRLQALSDTLAAMDQASGEYFALFQEFNEREDQVMDLEETMDEAFEEFTTLQTRLTQQSRQIQLERRTWADEAFQPVDSIFAARQEELDREVLYDTTGAGGIARFPSVPTGEWWVVGRYDRQFDELYWNLPITVEGGDPTTVILNSENAEVRREL